MEAITVYSRLENISSRILNMTVTFVFQPDFGYKPVLRRADGFSCPPPSLVVCAGYWRTAGVSTDRPVPRQVT
jgi:hypothetical protein